MLRRVLFLVFVFSRINDLLCVSVSENLVEQLVKDVMELKRLKTEQDKKIDEQGKLIKELEKQLMATTVKDKRLLMSLPNTQQPVPAFSASLNQHLLNLGNYQAITFDNIFTNIGNVYSPHTGAFTAPHNGTYYFVAVIMSVSGQHIETEICLNGKTQVFIYSHDNSYEQGTNSIVLTLKQGDMVWVRHRPNQGSDVYGHNWSSFSGFQIA